MRRSKQSRRIPRCIEQIETVIIIVYNKKLYRKKGGKHYANRYYIENYT